MFATAQKSASRSNEGAHVRSHRGRAARTCLTVVSADANVWLFSATTLHSCNTALRRWTKRARRTPPHWGGTHVERFAPSPTAVPALVLAARRAPLGPGPVIPLVKEAAVK